MSTKPLESTNDNSKKNSTEVKSEASVAILSNSDELSSRRKKAIAFVNSLESPTSDMHRLADDGPTDVSKAPAAVANEMVVSFVGNVLGQQRSDVANSFLLAQLAANKKYKKDENTQNWYQEFRNILENLGWTCQNFQFIEHKDSSSSFEVDKVIIDLLKAIASRDEMAILNTAIDSLGSLEKNKGALTIFSQASSFQHMGAADVGIAVNDNGALVIKASCFYMSTSQSTTRFLWTSYSSGSSKLYYSKQIMTLNEDIYSQVREIVIQKLGKNAKDKISAIEL